MRIEIEILDKDEQQWSDTQLVAGGDHGFEFQANLRVNGNAVAIIGARSLEGCAEEAERILRRVIERVKREGGENENRDRAHG